MIGLEQQAEEESAGMMGASSIPIIAGEDRKGSKTSKKKTGGAPKPNQTSSNKKGDPPLTKASSMIGGVSSMQLPGQMNSHNGFVYRHSLSTDPQMSSNFIQGFGGGYQGGSKEEGKKKESKSKGDSGTGSGSIAAGKDGEKK